jgi:hypothetical protein
MAVRKVAKRSKSRNNTVMRLHTKKRATAAAVIKPAQAHPRHFIALELTRFPITFLSLVNSTTMSTRGGASSPLRMADQKSIFTALIRMKSKANPTMIEAPITT